MYQKVLPLKLSIGGRVDRNDDQDVEPVAHYGYHFSKYLMIRRLSNE
jgi:hypothetical protein